MASVAVVSRLAPLPRAGTLVLRCRGRGAAALAWVVSAFGCQSAGVAEGGGVVVAVGVGVPLLGVGQIHDRIDGDEPAQGGVILTGRKMGQTAWVFGVDEVYL